MVISPTRDLLAPGLKRHIQRLHCAVLGSSLAPLFLRAHLLHPLPGFVRAAVWLGGKKGGGEEDGRDARMVLERHTEVD